MKIIAAVHHNQNNKNTSKTGEKIELVKCTLCQLAVTESNLYKHIETTHIEGPPKETEQTSLNCPECNVTVHNKVTLNEHISSQHTMSCNNCLKMVFTCQQQDTSANQIIFRCDELIVNFQNCRQCWAIYKLHMSDF